MGIDELSEDGTGPLTYHLDDGGNDQSSIVSTGRDLQGSG